MLDNTVRGGQIFLHSLTMFKQVLSRSIAVAVVLGVIATTWLSLPKARRHDWSAAVTYVKAYALEYMHDSWTIIYKNPAHSAGRLDVYDKYGLVAKQIKANKVLKDPYFIGSFTQVIRFVKSTAFTLIASSLIFLAFIFLGWWKFGKSAKATTLIKGGSVLTAKQVAKLLKSLKKASDFTIDGMPLVKDSETKHILVTGSTGTGKTNMINSLLPQVRKKGQAALVIDQTGEMISRYYSPERGDIIFNPMDERSYDWDFWTDCALNPDMTEKFAKVLFGFNKKGGFSGSDPFWENSAETVFCACISYLVENNRRSFSELKYMLELASLSELADMLQFTKAARYINTSNTTTANSILSVLATSTKPLSYLTTPTESNNSNKLSKLSFSLKQYFEEIGQGSSAWLFLSTAPSQRELTLPLIACMTELGVSFLMGSGINLDRRMWFIFDELAALGRLNALNLLMAESRKYGGCVLAGMQSVNQLFSNYGQYAGSTLLGQFGTKFIFRYTEPTIAKMFSEMFGSVEYKQHQKNTSYGAHEHRDGISYSEQEKKKPLVTADQIASLKDRECLIELPEAEVRIARMILPVTNLTEKHMGFVAAEDRSIGSNSYGNGNSINTAGISPNTNINIDSTSNRDFNLKTDQFRSHQSNELDSTLNTLNTSLLEQKAHDSWVNEDVIDPLDEEEDKGSSASQQTSKSLTHSNNFPKVEYKNNEVKKSTARAHRVIKADQSERNSYFNFIDNQISRNHFLENHHETIKDKTLEVIDKMPQEIEAKESEQVKKLREVPKREVAKLLETGRNMRL